MRYLRAADLKKLGSTALVRLDFNTEDEWRMEATLPTVRFLLKAGKKAVIVSHRGRPHSSLIRANGRIVRFDKKLSLRRDAVWLQRYLGRPVHFVPHFRFFEIKKMIAAAPPKSVFLLENIRFLKGEATPKPELAKKLVALADFYVNDAFAVCHHPGDSVVGVERFLPSYAGLELEKEIKVLSRVMRKPKRPLVLIVGGAKTADKLGVLKYFERKADTFLLGGGPANTLMHLRGVDVRKSLREEDSALLSRFRRFARHQKVVLPADWRMVSGKILDIGPKTQKQFREIIRRARTVIWSGPVGVIERRAYARGTLALARAVSENQQAFSLAGGGETVMFLRKHRLDRKFSFISTGGGAMLEFLSGRKLPGIAALEKGEPRQRRAALEKSRK